MLSPRSPDHSDVRSDTCNIMPATPVCKTTGAPTDVEVRIQVCKTTEVSTCKTVDIIDRYFSDEDNPHPKINVMKIAKESEGCPQAGRRRHRPDRFITCTTDTAIKAGSRKEKCDRCDYTSSKRQMHLHYRQHLTKHFVATAITAPATT